jgi:hypothetical protein
MFKLNIDTENSAFENSKVEEVTAILEALIDRLLDGQTEGKLRDKNGNTCGEFTLT